MSFAQQAAHEHSWGTAKEFMSIFANADPFGKQYYALRMANNKELSIKVNVNDRKDGDYHIIGSIKGHDQSTFYFDGNEESVKGKMIFIKTKEAYDIYTDDLGKVFIAPINIQNVICVDYNEYTGKEEEEETPFISPEGKVVAPQLESFPGAKGVIYLDFDGEYVTGGRWGTIDALPSNFSDSKITTIWTAVSEDYSPFNINVTTIRSLYDSANPKRRIMAIFTPTTNAAPGAGGVCYLNAFHDGTGDPAWVFNQGTKSALEAGSHECGHSFGLSHDGTPSQEYYPGHASWGPIMGAVYSRPIVQWSKGEYNNANNQEDDLARISSLTNGVGYRTDDHGNDPPNATPLVADADGIVKAVDNFGIIEKRTDKDVFKFSTSGGNITFSINPMTNSGSSSIPNLNIQARLLDNSGTEVVKSDLSGLNASISRNVAAGTYYLEIDGAGYGSPLNTGYSDYGSIGQFFILGNFPPGMGAGIESADNTHGIDIYPNPNSGSFTISLSSNSTEEGSIELLNSLGQVIITFSEKISGNYQKEIHLSNPPGIYCVVLKAGNDVWREKVIIK